MKGSEIMLLSRKEIYKPTKEEQIIFGHMGYAASKLWNIANYEKRNYKSLCINPFPDWYDQKKRLKDNFFYKNLPSQTAQNVLAVLQQAWKSFFELRKTHPEMNPKPPRFKNGKMDITFLKDAISIEKGYIRLSIPKSLKKYLKESENIDATFIRLKIDRFLAINIKQIQIKFTEDNLFTIIAIYEVPDVNKLLDTERYLSIDLGIKNSFTCYDSNGKSFIINGLLNISHYYDKRISRLQNINSSQQVALGIKYPKPSKQILSFYSKKKNKINDFLHKATKYIADYCYSNKITIVIIGDISNIRKDKNIGKNNQQLHSWPFAKIYQLLEYKLRLNGITLIKQKESYSSQCSPNSLKVSKKYAAKNNRRKRGLYFDSNMIYNADCVGAYNILRLYLDNINKPIPGHKDLNNPTKVSV